LGDAFHVDQVKVLTSMPCFSAKPVSQPDNRQLTEAESMDLPVAPGWMKH